MTASVSNALLRKLREQHEAKVKRPYYHRKSIDDSVAIGGWCLLACVAMIVVTLIAHSFKAILDLIL